MKRQVKGEAGFTLLELLFAAGVLAIGLSMLFGSVMSVSAVGRLAEDRQLALMHVSAILEEMRLMPFSILMTYEPPEFCGLTNEMIEIVCYDSSGGEIPLPIDTTPTGGEAEENAGGWKTSANTKKTTATTTTVAATTTVATTIPTTTVATTIATTTVATTTVATTVATTAATTTVPGSSTTTAASTTTVGGEDPPPDDPPAGGDDIASQLGL
ncbi:MAG: Type secretion system protein, partial [Candidatus Hydrogenedentes bacterium]|nr:Type secretion system protein [Candidatus Hydrogenedentota bacterium]